MNDTINQYVLAAGNGDTDAMAKLYAGTLKGSYFLASKLCDSEEEAADITRKAYAKVFCTIDKLKKPEAFEIWLKQMIASLYKDSRKFVFADADGGAHEPDSDFLPEAILENGADAEKVVSAIASLSPERRTAIILHYNNGMPVAVLSKFLGVSESTANAILSKARSEIVEKSGIKAPEYPELSSLPVLTRLFKKLAAEVSIDNTVVRDMFIFILDCVEAAKPSEPAEEAKEKVTAPVETVEETADEAVEETEENEDAEEVEEEESAEETEEEEETEESESEEVAEEAEATEEEASETEEVTEVEETEEPAETAEETVDKIEEEIVSFKDRISTLIGTEEETAEEVTEEVADEPAEQEAEIEEIEEAFEIEEAKEEAAAETEEAQDEDLLAAIKRSMEDLNDFAENEEKVELNEDTGAISFADYKKEDAYKPAEPVLPVETEKADPQKPAVDKKPAAKRDKKVVIIVAAITILIVAVIAVVIGISAKNNKEDETTKPTSAYSATIATQWKAVEALNAYDSIAYLNEEYAMFGKDGKFGLLDNFGNVVLGAKYDGFKMCSDGKDYNSENDYHLLAVIDGKDYELSYENGIPTVTSKEHNNHSTDTAATPGSDDYVERDRYFEGYAAAQNADGKWGYVAKDSDMLVVDYLYDAPNAHSFAADSCRGFDKGVVAVKKDGKMGIINMDGTVVPFEYEEILQGEDGVYVAKKGGEWGILLVGDEAIAFYADHQVETEVPVPETTDAPLGEPVGTYVARDDINVRSGPSSDYDKLGTIDKGTTIKVYEIRDSEKKSDSNDFAKIEYDGQIGWVSMGLLKKK